MHKSQFQSGMTTPLYMPTPGGIGHVSFDMLTCALNAQNWDAAKYIMNIYFKDSLTLKCAEDSTNKREHQRNSCIQTRKFKPPYLIHMEYFIEEIDSKGTISLIFHLYGVDTRFFDLNGFTLVISVLLAEEFSSFFR